MSNGQWVGAIAIWAMPKCLRVNWKGASPYKWQESCGSHPSHGVRNKIFFDPATHQICCDTSWQIFSCHMWLKKRGWSHIFSAIACINTVLLQNIRMWHFLSDSVFYPPLFLLWPLTTLISYHIWHPWTNFTQLRNCLFIIFHPFCNPWGKCSPAWKKKWCFWQMGIYADWQLP